tara:strand:- start:72482 stop:74980 length:2499 start_codon:yes stop_codon:yes gene_type:complete
MTTSKNRIIASLISNDTSKIKEGFTDSDSIVSSASLGVTAASGTATYSSADTLPASANDGDQALVTSTNRLYIYSSGGWYNIALVNTSPYFTTSPNASYELSNTGAQTNIEILAVDSEGINITYSTVADSDFSTFATITKDSDNGRRFTITLDSDQSVGATGTVTFRASDGVNIASALSTFSIVFKVANSNYTTLMLKADTAGTDNQVDASTNAYSITENGNVTSTALSPYHPGGYSTYFDGGTSTRITLPSDAGFAFGTGAYTVEAWVYISTSTTGAVIFDAGVANGSFSFLVEGGQLKLSKYGTGVQISSSAGAVNTNQWHHCAIVRTSNGANDTRLYVDGVLVGTGTDANNWTVTTTPSIGGANLANYTLNGYLRDLRVVKGTTVYTSAFTAPTEPLTAIANTSLLACHAPYIADGSSNNHALTASSQVSQYRVSPYDYLGYTKADYGGSVYFDGTGDYITAGSASDAALSSGTWTIEFWVWLTTDYAAGAQTILSNYDGSASSWYIQIRNNGALWLGASIGTPLSYVLSPEENRWYHIAFSNDASNSTGKLFVNGIEVDDHNAANYTSAHMGATSVPLTIGRLGNNTSQDFSGYISDIRIIDGTMLYTSNFTPPTAPLTAVTNTKLLTCTNKNDIWDAGTGSLLTKAGNTTASNTQRKFTGSSAIYLDGTNDYLDAGDIQFGANDFTIEGWFYFNSTANQCLIGRFHNYSSNQCWELIYEGGMRFQTNTGSFNSGTVAFTVQTGQWYHIAAVRSGSNKYLFIDGVLQSGYPINIGTGALQGESTGTVKIGTRHDLSKDFNGYIQDLRITEGLARYTSNFTPPTTEFSG